MKAKVKKDIMSITGPDGSGPKIGNLRAKKTEREVKGMRDINKAIADYQKKFGGNSAEGAFYAADVKQIRDTAEGLAGNNRDFELISNALQAGFMSGYRKGQADARKRAVR